MIENIDKDIYVHDIVTTLPPLQIVFFYYFIKKNYLNKI